MYCKRPFYECEIYENGDVYTCCPFFLKDSYHIGNIFESSSFDEIWYSEKALNLRKKILNSDYSLCNTEICARENVNLKTEYTCEHIPYPQYVKFSFDSTCNLRCIFCRDDYKKFDKQNEFLEILNTKLLSIIKNAKNVNITTVGELTASEYSIKLLDEIIKNSPEDLKFEINTNGLLFNEEFVKAHNLTDRIDNLVVSIHAITENTYNKIVKGSDFKKVIKNIEYISKLKKQGKIKVFSLVFVCTALNYKEIPDFINFASDMGASALIWEYRKHETQMDEKYNEYAVWEKTHPEYNDFVKIISNVKQIYKDDELRLPNLFLNLKPISPFEKQISLLKDCFRISKKS